LGKATVVSGSKCCPSTSQRGAKESADVQRGRTRRRRHVGRKRRCDPLRHLASCPVRRGAARAGEKRPCAHSAHPTFEGAPARRRSVADYGPRAYLRSNFLRRPMEQSEEREGQGDRWAGIEPLGQRLAGHHGDQRPALHAVKSTSAKLSDLGFFAWSSRPSKLPPPPSMPVQCHLSTQRMTGGAAVWTSSRPHLVGRGIPLHPTLD
jgi:hypothetical protein